MFENLNLLLAIPGLYCVLKIDNFLYLYFLN